MKLQEVKPDFQSSLIISGTAVYTPKLNGVV